MKIHPPEHLKNSYARLSDKAALDIVTNYERNMPNAVSANDWRDMFVLMAIKYFNLQMEQQGK